MDAKEPIDRCEECPLLDRPSVPGEGPDETDVVIVGWAPGKSEIEAGQPFVGRSGAVLDEALQDAELDRACAHITNVVLCYPVKARPRAPERNAFHERLIHEIKQRGPTKVLALGEIAIQAVLRESRSIEDLRDENPHRSPFLDLDTEVWATYHPGAVLRNHPRYWPPFASDLAQALGPRNPPW